MKKTVFKVIVVWQKFTDVSEMYAASIRAILLTTVRT
jgi:hypothetical protein